MNNERFDLCFNPGKCYSSRDGHCTALWGVEDSEHCRFFQTEAQHTESCAASMERLYALQRFDLLKQYYRIGMDTAKRICANRANILAFIRSGGGGNA